MGMALRLFIGHTKLEHRLLFCGVCGQIYENLDKQLNNFLLYGACLYIQLQSCVCLHVDQRLDYE